MWTETVDRDGGWVRMSAPSGAAASSPNPPPAPASLQQFTDEEDEALCAALDKYERGESFPIPTGWGPPITIDKKPWRPRPPSPTYEEWVKHKREEHDDRDSHTNIRKRAREFADEVLADAHHAASKHSRDHFAVALRAHVKAQLAWYMRVEYGDDVLAGHVEKLADEHENLANAMDGVGNQLSDIATTLENREY